MMRRLQAASWAELLPPLLELILEHLLFADYLRFPAVCKSWRAMLQDHRLRHAASPRYESQIPWMMLFDHQSPNGRIFYNPSEKRYYRIPFPTKDPYLQVSKDGWFLSANFLLVNLFTGSKIHILLPPPHIHYLPNLGDLSTAPTNPNCVLLCNFTDLEEDHDTFYYFYRFRDRMWTRLKHPLSPDHHPAICGGKFYEYFYTHKLFQTEPLPVPVVESIKMDKTALRISGSPKTIQSTFLVECEGQILLVIFIQMPRSATFQVFKADLYRKAWVKLESLGDRVLFLSFCGYSFSLSAAETQGPGNCIYYDSFWNEEGMLTEYNYESHQFMNSRFPKPQCGESVYWIIPNLCLSSCNS